MMPDIDILICRRLPFAAMMPPLMPLRRFCYATLLIDAAIAAAADIAIRLR